MLRNVIGPQVRRFRYQRGWSQAKLAVKLQVLGWDISRSGVGKIEAQLSRVSDYQMIFLATVLGVDERELFPKVERSVRVAAAVEKLLTPRRDSKASQRAVSSGAAPENKSPRSTPKTRAR